MIFRNIGMTAIITVIKELMSLKGGEGEYRKFGRKKVKVKI